MAVGIYVTLDDALNWVGCLSSTHMGNFSKRRESQNLHWIGEDTMAKKGKEVLTVSQLV